MICLQCNFDVQIPVKLHWHSDCLSSSARAKLKHVGRFQKAKFPRKFRDERFCLLRTWTDKVLCCISLNQCFSFPLCLLKDCTVEWVLHCCAGCNSCLKVVLKDPQYCIFTEITLMFSARLVNLQMNSMRSKLFYFSKVSYIYSQIILL